MSSSSSSKLSSNQLFSEVPDLTRSYGTRYVAPAWYNSNDGFLKKLPYHLCDENDDSTLVPIYDIRNRQYTNEDWDTNDYSQQSGKEDQTLCTFQIYNVVTRSEGSLFVITDQDNHALPFFIKQARGSVWGYIFQLQTEKSHYVDLPKHKNYPSHHYTVVFEKILPYPQGCADERLIENCPPRKEVSFDGYLGASKIYKTPFLYQMRKKTMPQGDVNPEDSDFLPIGTIQVKQSKKYGFILVDQNATRLSHYVYPSYATHMFELDNEYLESMKKAKYKELGLESQQD